ncbi:hypothetical protein LCGC14_0358910 [marine sediment metagenome]|uniref:Uncharacterized protein n=1 Tax=marine sediment metagenome TaxID=412755 RepID=A0A0F9VVY4_9ZZZZ
MAKDKKQKKVTKVERPYTDTLKVDLTSEELLAAGEELARSLDLVVSLEKEKKAYDADIKAQIEQAEAESRKLTARVRNKLQWAKVDCLEVRDYAAGRVIKTRLDTGEKLVEREMNHEEKQRRLCDSEGPIDEKPDK